MSRKYLILLTVLLSISIPSFTQTKDDEIKEIRKAVQNINSNKTLKKMRALNNR